MSRPQTRRAQFNLLEAPRSSLSIHCGPIEIHKEFAPCLPLINITDVGLDLRSEPPLEAESIYLH